MDYGKIIYQTHFLFREHSSSNLSRPPSCFEVANTWNVADPMWSGAMCASFQAHPETPSMWNPPSLFPGGWTNADQLDNLGSCMFKMAAPQGGGSLCPSSRVSVQNTHVGLHMRKNELSLFEPLYILG